MAYITENNINYTRTDLWLKMTNVTELQFCPYFVCGGCYRNALDKKLFD